MHQTLKIIIVLSALFFAQFSFAGLQKGVDAYNKKDYAAALKELMPLAKQGNAKAQNYLGLTYLDQAYAQEANSETPQSGTQKKAQAMEWFTKAAQQGDSEAQVNLGGVFQRDGNEAQAIQWYLAAAKLGNSDAESALGGLYLGKATNSEKPKPEFFAQALHWTLQAAEHGNVSAQASLAQMYHEGWGVEKNYKTAMEWYCKAVERGDYSSSAFFMGRMYLAGEGVTAIRVIADALMRLGDEQDDGGEHPLTVDESARPLENKMSSQEIAAAKKLANEMAKPGNLLKALDQYASHPTAIEVPFYSPANGKDSLCTDDENILLSCVTKTRLISVCASKNQSATKRYIQYRVEKNGKLEFEFPKEKVQPSKVFTFDSGENISGSATLGFKNGDYLYQIQHDWDKYNLDEYSVNVSRNGSAVSHLLCMDNVIGNFSDESIEGAGLSKQNP